jgi:hypothetical protein
METITDTKVTNDTKVNDTKVTNDTDTKVNDTDTKVAISPAVILSMLTKNLKRVQGIGSICGSVYELETDNGIVYVDAQTELPTEEALFYLVHHNVYTPGLGMLWSIICANDHMVVTVTNTSPDGREVESKHSPREARKIEGNPIYSSVSYADIDGLKAAAGLFKYYNDVWSLTTAIIIMGPLALAKHLLDYGMELQ